MLHGFRTAAYRQNRPAADRGSRSGPIVLKMQIDERNKSITKWLTRQQWVDRIAAFGYG